MTRLLAAMVLGVLAGCAPVELAVTPTATPSAARVPFAFTITPQLAVNDDGYAMRTGGRHVTDGDLDLAFRLEFFADMDRASVAAAIHARTPEALNLRWPLDAKSVEFDVAAGTSTLVIDPTGARSATGDGVVAPTSWTVERPTSAIAIYDPTAVARGETSPSHRYTVPLNLGGPVYIDRDGRRALVYHQRGNRSAVSVVDLASGRRTGLPPEIEKIASNGARFEWLPDGRLLTLGSHDTIVSTAAGTELRRLPALVGQGGPVSPRGDQLAVWSYAHSTAAIVEIETGTLRPLGKDFLRCSVNGGVALTWSPDGRTLAVSHCTEDMSGSSRTTYLDASTGRVVATTPDVSVLAWLKDGSQLLARWSSGPSDPRRFPEASLTLLRTDGTARTIASASPFALSPDGYWLLDAAGSPTIRLIRLQDGATYDLPIPTGQVSWTPAGNLAAALPRPP